MSGSMVGDRYDSGMDFARIYGPSYRTGTPQPGAGTRSLTVDLEVLTEALDAIVERWDLGGHARANGAKIVDEYTTARGPVRADELAGLGAYDRNTLSLYRKLVLAGGEVLGLNIYCPLARVHSTSPQPEQEQMFVADYILKNGQTTFTWKRMQFVLPLVAVFAIIVGYIGSFFSLPGNGFAHLLTLAVVVLTVSGGLLWSRTLYVRNAWADGAFRVRAQSRKETTADRANRHANIRVAVMTTIVLLPVTIGGTLLTAWLNGALNLS